MNNQIFQSLYDIEPGLGFTGNYRGVVVANDDPLNKGRVKVWVPGVFAEEWKSNTSLLPWAEVIMPPFGGNWTNENGNQLNIETGISTVPHTSTKLGLGANAWLFFEQGNQNYPIVFGFSHGGEGWLSEHNNQHVIKTDNVTVKIDENPTHDNSTNKFDSNNEQCTDISKQQRIMKMPTRVGIEIWNKSGCAINLNVKGNVNIKVEGNVYEQITGDKHETLIGNLYRKHIGDIHFVHNGNTLHEITGDTLTKMSGNVSLTQNGNINNMIFGYMKQTIESEDKYVHNSYNVTIGAAYNIAVNGLMAVNVNGEMHEQISGKKKTFSYTAMNFAKSDIVNASDSGNIITQSMSMTGEIIDKAAYVTRQAMIEVEDMTSGTIQHNQGIVVVTEKEF